MSISVKYHDLVSLFYRFLRLQPFGWEGPRNILQSERLPLPALLLLRSTGSTYLQPGKADK